MIAMQSTSSEPIYDLNIGDVVEPTELGHRRLGNPNRRLPNHGTVTAYSSDGSLVRVEHCEGWGMYHLDSWKLAEFVEREVVK